MEVAIPLFWNDCVRNELPPAVAGAPEPLVILFAPDADTRWLLNVVAVHVATEFAPVKSQAAMADGAVVTVTNAVSVFVPQLVVTV